MTKKYKKLISKAKKRAYSEAYNNPISIKKDLEKKGKKNDEKINFA